MDWSDLDIIFKGVDFGSFPKIHSNRQTSWKNVDPELMSELLFPRLEMAFHGIANITPNLKRAIKQSITMAYNSANVDGNEFNHPTFKEFINHISFISWNFTNFYDKEWNHQRLQYLIHGDVLKKTVDEEIIDLNRQLKQYEILKDDLNMLAKLKDDILNLVTECPDYSKYLTPLEMEKVLSMHRTQEYPSAEHSKSVQSYATPDREIELSYLRSLLRFYKISEDDIPELSVYKEILKKISSTL